MQGYPATQLYSGNRAINRAAAKQEEGRPAQPQAVRNGGPRYPSKLRPASTLYGQSTIPGLGPAPKPAIITITNNNIEVTGEKEVRHLWSEPIKPSHAVIMSSLVDDRDMRANRDETGNQEDSISEQLPDFPPGYKPNYKGGYVC